MRDDTAKSGRDQLSREVDRLLRQLHPAAAEPQAVQPVAGPTPLPGPEGARASQPAPKRATPPAPGARAAGGPAGPGATPLVGSGPAARTAGAGLNSAPGSWPGAAAAPDPGPGLDGKARGGVATARVGGPPTPLGVWMRVTLGALLAVAATQWPYAHCGLPLAAYLVTAIMVFVAGAWAAHASWRARIGRAHLVAILLLFAGTALAAQQVLPRFGYARVPVTWSCSR